VEVIDITGIIEDKIEIDLIIETIATLVDQFLNNTQIEGFKNLLTWRILKRWIMNLNKNKRNRVSRRLHILKKDSIKISVNPKQSLLTE